MAEFYANENFPLPTVEALRRLGHDVLTIQETGRAGRAMPDDQVLAFAAQERRILLTFNRQHFIRLHETGHRHNGIIVCTFDPDFIALAHPLDSALREQTNVNNQLIRVNRPSTP